MTIDEVLKKVRKLRALADGTTSIHEAQAAAAKADALLTAHRLTEADIGADVQAESPVEGEPLHVGRKVVPWRSILFAALSKHYGCYGFTRRTVDGVVTHCIVGNPSDVAIVTYMAAWLSSEVERLALAEHGTRARNAFRTGASMGIRATLLASKAAVEREHAAQHGTGAAMVLADRSEQARKWFEASVGRKIGKPRAPARVDAEAFHRGKEAGGRLHLGAALPGGGTRALTR